MISGHYVHLFMNYINSKVPPSKLNSADKAASSGIATLDPVPVNCNGPFVPVAEAIGTVEEPSRTKVDPLKTVVAVGLTPITDAIMEPIFPSTAEEMIASALDNGIVEAPFTSTLPPVGCSEYVVPSIVTGEPPGTRVSASRAAAEKMTAFALDKGIVETPFTITSPPVGCSEYVVPSIVIGEPPGTKVWVPRAAGAVIIEFISASRLAAGIVEAPFTTTLPEGSRESTVPETVMGLPPGASVWEPMMTGVWLGGTTAESGTVEVPSTTTLLPWGSRESTVPETVTGEPPGVNVWDPRTGGGFGVVEGDGAPGSCADVLAGWAGAELDVAGPPGAGLVLPGGADVFEGSAGLGLELAGGAGCGVLEGSTGGDGFEVAGGCGSGVLEGCDTGSAGGAVVVV